MGKINKIFEEIDEAIKGSISLIPITLEDSEFIKKYRRIKDKWIKK